ncbi:MAG: hypothetical protein AAGF11_40910 [Myxococcota bacterium]
MLLPLVLVGCPGDGDDGDGDTGSSQGCADPSDPSAPRLSVTDDVVEDTTWTCNNIYLLDQTVVFVSDATLTIEAGTTIEGTAGSALVITDTAQINAQGTSSAPVVMTSANPVGQRSRGDWGGLVLFGQAPVNLDNGSGVAEGLLTPVSYGGMESTHNCGTLQYTRVEWAGFVISDDNELNGITFYACGSGTTVDHVQVHMGADDGIEMFGGNFDASNLVVTGAGDDSIDCDQGYQGTLTNVFIHQDPTMGDACFEWSNGSHSSTAEPLTGPTVINGTCVGSGDGNESKGATLKEGTDAGFISTLFINLTGDNIKLENLETQTRAEAGNIAIDGTIFCDGNAFSIEEEGDEDDPPPTWTAMDFADWVAAAGNNQFGVDCGLPSAAWGDPDIQPPPGSTPDGAGASPGQSYAGAVDPNGENWTREPWINYDPAG